MIAPCPDYNSCGYYYERNKGNVRSTCLEIESEFAATSQLTLGLAASYTHAVTNGAIADLDAPDAAGSAGRREFHLDLLK